MNNLGLLLSRFTLGVSIAAHGAQKAFGAFEGPGPQGAAQFLESLGFTPGERFATAAAWTEISGGAMIALGLGGPLGPAAIVSTMVVAQTAVHAKNGYFTQKNGIELGVMYGAGAVALASAGFGRFSLDEAFGWQKLREPWLTTLAMLGGVTAGYLILAQRTLPATADPASGSAARDVEMPQTVAESLAATQDHIAAAQDDRPVPADLLSAAHDHQAPQT